MGAQPEPLKEDPDAAAARLSAAQHGLITRKQALALAFTDDGIRWRRDRGLWEPVHWGVYRFHGVPESREQAILAACLAANGVASHRAAAFLLEVPEVSYAIDLTVTGERHPLDGVTFHRAAPVDFVDRNRVAGIPATSLTRTVIDLAAILATEELEALLDHVLARRRTRLAYLNERLRALGIRGRHRAKLLQELLAEREGARPADSPPQRELERLIVEYGIPPGIREYVIQLADGRTRAVDYGWPDPKLAYQVESYRHHSTLIDHTNDTVRDADIVAEGWRVLRGTPEQIRRDPAGIAAVIQRALAAGPC